MAQFNLPMPNIANPKVSSGGGDMGAIKLQMGQMYSARLESLGNQISQVKIAVGQQVVTQPLPQLPPQVRPGQNYQVSVTTDKNGQAVINFYPEGGKAASQAQVMKINLTDAQLVNLLSLNKNYQAKPDGSVQTQAQVVLQGSAKTPALKLPGLGTHIKLPEGLAALVKDSKTVSVAINAKNGKFEMQLSLPNNKGPATTFKLPLAADKVVSIVRQNIAKSPDMPLQLQANQTTPSKITLPNQQSFQLPSKVAADAQVKVTTASNKQLIVTVTQNGGKAPSKVQPQAAIPVKATPATNNTAKAIATITLDKNTTVSALKAPVQQAAGDSGKLQPQQTIIQSGDKVPAKGEGQLPTKAVIDGKVVIDGKAVKAEPGIEGKAVVKGEAGIDSKEQIKSQNLTPLPPAGNSPNLSALQAEQKQALNKLIDPLIRILLPKKLSFSEGLKSLQQIEKQLPDVKVSQQQQSQPSNSDKPLELKQVLTELSKSIPDQNSPLNEKTIANILGTQLNFNPGKVMTSPQPTPANAIASALQLLLGAKTVQTDAKVTPQVIQQLTALLKNPSGKEAKTAKGIKAMTNNLATTEFSSGSLKSLVGLTSNMRHQQLENTEKKLDGNPQLNITMPLKVDDEIKELSLSINEDEENADKDNRKVSIWQLNLTFDLGELGKMMVSAKLKEGEVSMQMYAEKQGALNQINKFSETLEQRLEFHGVKIKQIQSSLGKINHNPSNKKLTSLLQIKV